MEGGVRVVQHSYIGHKAVLYLGAEELGISTEFLCVPFPLLAHSVLHLLPSNALLALPKWTLQAQQYISSGSIHYQHLRRTVSLLNHTHPPTCIYTSTPLLSMDHIQPTSLTSTPLLSMDHIQPTSLTSTPLLSMDHIQPTSHTSTPHLSMDHRGGGGGG